MKLKRNLYALGAILSAGFVLKFTYLFASSVWRSDLYYYMESARTVLDGGVAYRDFGDSHPPIIYLDFYLMAKLFGYVHFYTTIKVFMIAIQTLSAYLVYLIFAKLKGYRSGILYSLLFLVLISVRMDFWPHNIPVVFLLPMFAGLYFLVKDDFAPSLMSFFLFGFFASLAMLTSTNVIFYTLMVPLLSIRNRGFRPRKNLSECAVAFAGFLIPVLAFVIYFAIHHSLGDWYFWNIGWASIYAGYKPWYMKVGHFFWGFIVTWQWIPFFMISFYAVFRLIKNRSFLKDRYSFFVLSLFLCAVLSKTVMNKPVPRYYLYMLPGILFALEYGFSLMHGRVKKIVIISAGLFTVYSLFICNYSNWKFPVDRFFNVRSALRSEIVRLVPEDKTIFVWDAGYEIYFETKRKRSKTSFFSPSEQLEKSRLWKDNKYRDTEKMWKRFMTEFLANPPDYLVDLTMNFGQTDWTPEDGERIGIHKVYYDMFRGFVDSHYVVIDLVNNTQRILKKVR
jgi:hypothetical protein